MRFLALGCFLDVQGFCYYQRVTWLARLAKLLRPPHSGRNTCADRGIGVDGMPLTGSYFPTFLKIISYKIEILAGDLPHHVLRPDMVGMSVFLGFIQESKTLGLFVG